MLTNGPGGGKGLLPDTASESLEVSLLNILKKKNNEITKINYYSLSVRPRRSVTGLKRAKVAGKRETSLFISFNKSSNCVKT